MSLDYYEVLPITLNPKNGEIDVTGDFREWFSKGGDEDIMNRIKEFALNNPKLKILSSKPLYLTKSSSDDIEYELKRLVGH